MSQPQKILKAVNDIRRLQSIRRKTILNLSNVKSYSNLVTVIIIYYDIMYQSCVNIKKVLHKKNIYIYNIYVK